MSCFISSGKLGTLKWGCASANDLFWQTGYGAAPELCPRTATAYLEWCSAPYGALGCMGFLGSDVLMVVSFERCHHMVQGSCSMLRIWGDCHIKLFLIYTLESENLKSIIVNYKTFWQQSFWYWDTELLWESFAGQIRVVNQFFSTYCWEGNRVLAAQVMIQCWES